MAFALGPLVIGEPSRLWWLFLLVPLILFYLIRPKPKMREIPSLMFFMKATGRNKLLSFFRMFVHDFMMIVQLLILLALLLIPAQPSIKVQHDIAAANTVIVIDASASMQTKEGATTRFDKAISAAKGALTSHNSIVVAEERPRLLAQDIGSGDAQAVLNLLRPTDAGSGIGDAIILAGEVLRGKEGRVIVISDFISTTGVDPDTAKAVLQSRDLVVNYINVGTAGKHNVGIVDLKVDDQSTTVYVKNFNDEEKTVTLQIGSDDKPLTIPAKGIVPYVFETLPKVTKIHIEEDDDLLVDNTAYTSAPERQPVKVLLLTNNPSQFLTNALKAWSNVDLTVSQPPVVAKGNFDVVIVHDVDSNQVLAGTYDDMLKNVQKNAKTAIVAAQDDSLNIDYRGLVPFGLTGQGENGFITVETPTRFTTNIEFGKLPKYFTTNLQAGVVPIATVGNGTAVITVATVPGGGKLIWYGILEKGSDFKFSPYYPIFWYELIKYATGQKDVTGMNDRTGNTLLLDHPEDVQTPSGSQTTNRIILDRAGLYTLSDRTVAVNLLNEQESDINPRTTVGDTPDTVQLKPVRELRTLDWEMPLLFAALLILFIELLYVKIRGDV
jgi:hypothetical protein